MYALALVALIGATASAVPLIGDPAPEFLLRTIDGGTVVDRRQLLGRVTVVEFFATWCVPCGRSMEDLREIRGLLGPDIKILIIAVESEAPDLRAYFAKRPAPPGAVVVQDSDGDTARRWGKDRLPTTFFVKGDGIIRHINRGHGPGFRARAMRWLRAMLAPPP